MNDFERFVRDAEGELSATKSTLDAYEKERRDFEKRFENENQRYKQVREKCRQWREEVSFAQRHLDRAKAIAKSSTASPMVETLKEKPRPLPEPAPEPEPEPEQREVTGSPSLPFPHAPFQSFSPAPTAGYARFDRAYAKRKIRGWRASYPLAPSYKAVSRIERQALTAEITESDRYREWLRAGEASVTDSRASITMGDLYKVATYCYLDAAAIMTEARKVHLDISCYGTYGVDFMWLPK